MAPLCSPHPWPTLAPGGIISKLWPARCSTTYPKATLQVFLLKLTTWPQLLSNISSQGAMGYFMLALPVCVDFFQPLTLHIQYLSPLWQWPSQPSQREHWPQEWLEELGTARCPVRWLLSTLKAWLVDPPHASRMMFHKRGLAEASELGCLLIRPIPHLMDDGITVSDGTSRNQQSQPDPFSKSQIKS